MDARQDPALLEPAVEQVRRVWSSIGFRPFTERIWIMDPHRVEHSKALVRIGRRLGL
jgi:hypothetical protein